MKKKLILMAVTAFCLLVVMYFGADTLWGQITKPALCRNCHETRTEFLVWSISSHSQVDCLECHGGQGYKEQAQQVLKLMTHLYLHYAQVEGKETGFEAQIPDERCQQCHTSTRAISPGGDIRIPHQEHIANPAVLCVDCHRNVIHAGAAAAQIVAQVDQDLNDDQIRSQLRSKLQHQDFLPPMSLCQQCHDSKQAPSSCQTCHQEIDIPDNHQEEGWINGVHGKLARQGVSKCIHCHSLVAGSAPAGKTEDLSITQVIEGNQFCQNCHLQRPSSHNDDWTSRHWVSAQDTIQCSACHQLESQAGQSGLAVSCATCHQHNHSSNWLRQHPLEVKDHGAKTCYTCHGTSNCADCHTNRAAKLLRGMD